MPGARPLAAADPRPGRACPVSYCYAPSVFDRAPDLTARTLYVVGGLYGNVEALDAIAALAAAEGDVSVVFNGDFHWFDVDAADFAAIGRGVARHARLRGNVETELAQEASDAGCGCAYPADVSDAEVSRSNAILERLRETARADEAGRVALGGLAMHLVAGVDGARIGIVHGDASSLAGWGFAAARLDAPGHRRWIDNAFRAARVDAFACSHTCLPAMRRFAVDGREAVVANNGAAGMPNFSGTRFGLITRISGRPYRGAARLHGTSVAGVFVEALRVDYDDARWMKRFLASWPEGSSAHASYHARLRAGPRHAVADAAPRAGS
ncbi:MAG TPA: hypothetical protein VFE23_12615 [Usitatibacter sp.]|nr:hypothetical protein [Usitatibacter sp.]